MNVKHLIDEYNNPKSGLADYWDKLSENPDFKKILVLARIKMGKYAPSSQESDVPHIQAERTGALKGWIKLESVLLSTSSRSKPFSVVESNDAPTFVDHFSESL